MIRNLQLDLPIDDKDYMLSIAQIRGETHTTVEIALMEYFAADRGYRLICDPVFVETAEEMFDIISDAYEGDLSIFLDQYYVDFEIDNDNQPMLNLVVDNGDWPEDRADD